MWDLPRFQSAYRLHPQTAPPAAEQLFWRVVMDAVQSALVTPAQMTLSPWKVVHGPADALARPRLALLSSSQALLPANTRHLASERYGTGLVPCNRLPPAQSAPVC